MSAVSNNGRTTPPIVTSIKPKTSPVKVLLSASSSPFTPLLPASTSSVSPTPSISFSSIATSHSSTPSESFRKLSFTGSESPSPISVQRVASSSPLGHTATTYAFYTRKGSLSASPSNFIAIPRKSPSPTVAFQTSKPPSPAIFTTNPVLSPSATAAMPTPKVQNHPTVPSDHLSRIKMIINHCVKMNGKSDTYLLMTLSQSPTASDLICKALLINPNLIVEIKPRTEMDTPWSAEYNFRTGIITIADDTSKVKRLARCLFEIINVQHITKLPPMNDPNYDREMSRLEFMAVKDYLQRFKNTTDPTLMMFVKVYGDLDKYQTFAEYWLKNSEKPHAQTFRDDQKRVLQTAAKK